MKPAVLLIDPILPDIERVLDECYELHRLYATRASLPVDNRRDVRYSGLTYFVR